MATAIYGKKHLVSFDGTNALHIRLYDGPLHLAWRHSAMTSDFIAETMTLSFRASEHQTKTTRHDIGYLTNELIENSIKFRAGGEIAIEARLDADQFKMRIVNLIDHNTVVRFQQLLSRVTAGDPSVLLIEQFEASVLAGGNASGLGLLTLMSDYQVQLAWRFDDDSPQKLIKLQTYAAMAISSS